jgi:LmbE family N-acetylglucosaminyl deacetylase
MALRLRDGWTGSLVVVTNGENGFKTDNLPPAERIAIRQREQREAVRKLGLTEVIFLGYRDGFLAESEELRARLVEVIRRVKPETIFSFDPANQEFDDLNLFHRDHRVTARAVFDAVLAARNLWMYPGRTHATTELLFFGTHRPDHFVDITEVIDLKLALLACHGSQFPDFAKIAAFVRDEVSAPYGDYRHCERFRRLAIRQHA